MTINQAKLFAKAYTGIDPEAEDAKSVKLSLVIDPRAPNKPPATSPAFDISVLLDIPDTVVLERVANLKCKFPTTFTKVKWQADFGGCKRKDVYSTEISKL